MAPGHGKTLRRSSRERRRPPSPPSVVVKKPVRSANSVVNRKSSLANQTSSEESASESASETQDSSSSRSHGQVSQETDVDDDDVVMEEEDVGEASAPEPPSKAPSKPKKLSQIAAERSESPVAPKAPPVGVNASEYIVTDLEECAAGVDLEWAKIKFPVSFDDSTLYYPSSVTLFPRFCSASSEFFFTTLGCKMDDDTLNYPVPDGLDPLFRAQCDTAGDFMPAYERAVLFSATMDSQMSYLWQQALEIGFRAGGSGGSLERAPFDDYSFGHDEGVKEGRTSGLRDGKKKDEDGRPRA
ncbi:hypothetical protein C8R47DRAFT_1258853 [Mycena vitilis]|nr:hypothetical protein C8R47DRAFT_1258853 [Mycena vitilis]